jgi:hypothetical protein
MTNRTNFRAWFASQIHKLSPDRDAGFVIAMISFPLLERYLRQKTNAEPKNKAFIAGLLKALPELGTTEAAILFWNSYRHGLLHNVTMNRESHGLTHDSEIVCIEKDKVWLNPVLFAERIISTIENDFEIFEKGKLPLPTVAEYGRVPENRDSSPYFLGTSVVPPGKTKD